MNRLWVTLNQNDHLWVTFKYLRPSVDTPLFSMFWVVLVGTKHATSVCECDRHPWQWRITSTHPSVDTVSVSWGFLEHLCVTLFLLNRYWGIVTVPGSIPYGSRPGVAGSSPCTLTTSLAIPVPSSSSSNGPSNYSVDNPSSGQVQSSFGLIGESPKWWKRSLGHGVPKFE